MVEKGWPFL